MQEMKSLVRSLFAFCMRPIKYLFRMIPVFGRVGRAIFRLFPILRTIYLRLLPPPDQQGVDAAAGAIKDVFHLETPLPRKRPLTPRAEEIMRDLHAAIQQNHAHRN